MIDLLVLPVLLVAGQEKNPAEVPPKVTYEVKGDFRDLVMDLERRFKGSVRFESNIPSREVSISVRDAGYFEVLDALCRAHKGARYLEFSSNPRLDETILGPGPWVEYPSAYYSHFKTVVLSMNRIVHRAADGEGVRVDVTLLTLGPPWISISDYSGAVSEWKIDDVRDTEGKPVPVAAERYAGERVQVGTFSYCSENSQMHQVFLSGFDLSKGLKGLAGTVKIRTAEARIERMAAKEGPAVDLGKGTLKIVSVTPSMGDDKALRVSFSYTPKDSKSEDRGLLRRAIEGRLRREGGKGDWVRFSMPDSGRDFAITLPSQEQAPEWVELRIRGEERVIEVPFRFADVRFPEK